MLCAYAVCMYYMHTHIKTGLITVFYTEIIHIFFKSVLRCQAGITQITLFIFPFLQASIVKILYIILNNKGDNTVAQTFLEKY